MKPISIRSLRKTFGSTVAVDRVDLDIEAGTLFFLLGPSGCGKTTLLRMLAGFAEPTAGTIHFGDEEVTHRPANRRRCGMVFQNYALWPHMTVRQNVAFGLDVRRTSGSEKARRTADALALVQMSEYADRKPNELSGGQQQRVALARALVIEPDVLLLDEPLSNLDARLRLDMRAQIRRICKAAGTTTIYVTHDQKEALSMADGIAVMNRGLIVQVGPPRQLYGRPRDRFVADFLGQTNFLTAELRGRDGDAVTLDSPCGRLVSTGGTSGDGRDATAVTCSIRPEAIRILDADEQAENGFEAQIEGVTYLGEMAQYDLRVGDLALKAFEINPRPRDGAGANLRCAVDPEDVVILEE
ncbi:MAG: spermidine/putrescine ABC transporter ATP-binding protein [Phycisphaeraceae bacterium]|nr:spermidine/putrescine ABC transporter ATP-binding protein [Phycisphaeraceae bacterium]